MEMKFKILILGGLFLIISSSLIRSLIDLNLNYNIFLLISSLIIGIIVYILTLCIKTLKKGEN